MDLKSIYHQTAEYSTAIVKELSWCDLETAINFTLSAETGNSSRHAAYISLPVLAYIHVGGAPENAVPLSASWAIYLTAFAIFDDLIDQDHPERPWARWELSRAMNTGLGLLFAAQTALAQLDCAPEIYRGIMHSISKALMLTARGQSHPPANFSLSAYFHYITYKSALHIAEFVRTGAHLATSEPVFLQAMFEYGLGLGLSAQLANDLQHTGWRNDLRSGIYTLPLLCGLSLVNHPAHPRLKAIVEKFNLRTEVDIDTICDLLTEMRVEQYCARMADAYLSKAELALNRMPHGKATEQLRFLIGRE